MNIWEEMSYNRYAQKNQHERLSYELERDYDFEDIYCEEFREDEIEEEE